MRRLTARGEPRLLTATERGELAFDVGPNPRTIGVVLLLDAPAPSEDALAAVLRSRLPRIPRWSCRVLRPAGGRPRWDPVVVDPADHVRTLVIDSDAEDAVLAAAVDVMREPWDLSAAPPWRLTRLVSGTGRDAVVLTLHHVLTDGRGVLATATCLLAMESTGSATPPATGLLAMEPTGSATPPASVPPPVPPATGPAGQPAPQPPGRRAPEPPTSGLRRPVVPPHGPLRPALRTAFHAARTVLLGLAELAAGVGPVAPRTSLTRPMGPGFCLAVADLDLAQVRAAARRHRATVNDVLLVAATGALGRLLERRGESAHRLLCSVPVSRVRPGDADRRARTGVLRVPVPVSPGLSTAERLRRTAAWTGRRRRFATGESAPLLARVFTLIDRVGSYRWFLERQRVINTVVSNLRGPAEPLAVAGVPVAGIVPVAAGAGNVPVYFTALSYAGRLAVTLRADRAVEAELPALVQDVQAIVDEIART